MDVRHLGMDLRQIQYFVALFEEHSITQAARRLNVVQPALSMQISRLEKKFNTQLFERTSRGVIPTVIGREFYVMCQKILDDVYEATRHLQAASGKVSGEIVIGLMPSVSANVLPGVLTKYKAAYPDVILRVIEAYSGSLIEWMYSGKLDLAVVNTSGMWTGMSVLPLFRDHLVLAIGRKKRARITDCPASTLNNYRLVLPSPRQGMRALIDSILAVSGIVLKPEIELDSLGPTIELVRQSEWATILPVIAVIRAVESKMVTAHKIVEPTIMRDVVVVHNTQRPLTVAAQLFVKMLKDEVQALMGSEKSPAISAPLVKRP
jgi:DNA-binding transcriptional LysR family regulator